MIVENNNPPAAAGGGHSDSMVDSPQDVRPKDHTPNDGYEMALDALLSLGGDKGAIDPEEPHDGSMPLGEARTRDPITGITRVITAMHAPETVHTFQGPDETIGSHPGVSENRVLELLRYYRYEVAPWVSIQQSMARVFLMCQA